MRQTLLWAQGLNVITIYSLLTCLIVIGSRAIQRKKAIRYL